MFLFSLKHRFLFFLIPLLFFLPSWPGHSQFYERGQDPASLRWKQIRTTNYQIIFPESYLSEAQRLANILEYAYNYVSFSLKNKPRKISVIIHNYTVHYNGFVAWAPKRMELYPTAPQDIYPQDALEQLAIHELRHVVQVDKLYQGITRILYYLFGEMAPGAISGMLPVWYLEGDAVATETALTQSGRGRLPSFEMELRTLSLEKGQVYTYDKAYMGSYRDNVPDYYQYGYQMIAYSRQKYGSRWWDKSLNFVARNPYLLSPVHFSLYNNIGLNKRRLYDVTFHELNSLWKENTGEIRVTSFDTLNIREGGTYTSYRFPQYLNDSTLVVEKSSIDKTTCFVSIDRNGNEKRLHIPGFYRPVRLSAGHQKIVWAENAPDIRWGNRSYSVIKVFDLRTGQEVTLTRGSRYFSPALSPDGSSIAAVEVSIASREKLIILDAQTGAIRREIAVPENHHVMMPAWTEDGGSLVLIVLTGYGKNIQRVSLSTGVWENILDPGFEDILNLIPFSRYILYHATYSGIDNIYAVDTVSRRIFQITSSLNGAFDVAVSPDGKRMAYSDYCSRGYNIAETMLDESLFMDFTPGKPKRVSWDTDLASQEATVIGPGDIPSGEYEVKSFNKFTHLFHFHSWAPLYTDLEKIELENFRISPGFMLLSQNQLSTAFSSVGYAYEEGMHRLYSSFTYKGFYPVIDFRLNWGGDAFVSPDTLTVSAANLSYSTMVYLPLNLTRNRFVKGLVPSVEAGYRNRYIFNRQQDRFEHGLWTFRYRLYFYSYLKMAHRDILPRWGQVMDLRYSSYVFHGEDNGSDYSFRVTAYLPGIMNNHSIKLKGGFEKRDVKRFIFYNNSLEFSRGYESHVRNLAENLQHGAAEYHFPLWYPDLRLSSVAYFKRLRSSLFYDYTRGKMFNTGTSTFNPDFDIYTSVGGSMMLDFHFLRIRFPLTLGLQYAYLPQLRTYDLSLVFNVDVFGLNINSRPY